jgi:3-hydroxyacyl-CoA dehydrogenase
MSAIEKVGVIGAGVMGASIAAQIANAGTDVVLLDIVPEGAKNRSVVAEGALKKMLKTSPAPFMHKRNAKRVATGNIEDNLDLLSDCDWIIEVVIEKHGVKQDLYKKIDKVRKSGAIISSNTSTIPLENLIEGLPGEFAENFAITHFFNPPRYMRLLELVKGPKTSPEAVKRLVDFADEKLGKTVVECKDRPGFIANRIGVFWMNLAVAEAFEMDLTVEEADSVIARPMGIPKTGVFALMDLVGIDLVPLTLASMSAALPKSDPFHQINQDIPLIRKMIEDGYTGRKGKGGFYRLNKESGKKVKEAIDLKTGKYAPAAKPRLKSVKASKKGGLRALVEHQDKGGRYAWKVLSETLAYTALVAAEVSDDILGIDEAMKTGYNWAFGPFELIDKLGASWFAARLKEEGRPVPPLIEEIGEGTFYRSEKGRAQYWALEGAYKNIERADGVLLLSDVKLASKPVEQNYAASLWDLGDGVLCLEFHTKMNAIDMGVLKMIETAIKTVSSGYKALVIHNEGSNFSVGANIGVMLFAANIAAWGEVEGMVKKGQAVYKALKYAPFPVVGAPWGMALGGGCEVLLHCDVIEAHAETYMGLVEVGVGVVPGWGGCKEMLARWTANKKRPGGPMPPVIKVFETIGTAQVSKSAEEAKDFLFLRPHDGVTMNRDRLLANAKAKALELAKDYSPPELAEIPLPGETARTAMKMAVHDLRKSGKATPYDVVVTEALAGVLSGGDADMAVPLSEDDVFGLEGRAFMELVRQDGTLARIEHMLETGKPLRN